MNSGLQRHSHFVDRSVQPNLLPYDTTVTLFLPFIPVNNHNSHDRGRSPVRRLILSLYPSVVPSPEDLFSYWKLARKRPQNSAKRSSSPAVTLATPHKKTCHHRSMRESERVTAFIECRLLSTPGNRTVLFFWHGAAHEEAPQCWCVASHVWWVCWIQMALLCSYSLRVDYREDLVGDCLTEMVGN